jgi:hypothetical protein
MRITRSSGGRILMLSVILALAAPLQQPIPPLDQRRRGEDEP